MYLPGSAQLHLVGEKRGHYSWESPKRSEQPGGTVVICVQGQKKRVPGTWCVLDTRK